LAKAPESLFELVDPEVLHFAKEGIKTVSVIGSDISTCLLSAPLHEKVDSKMERLATSRHGWAYLFVRNSELFHYLHHHIFDIGAMVLVLHCQRGQAELPCMNIYS
jgi:hypothetical protein